MLLQTFYLKRIRTFYLSLECTHLAPPIKDRRVIVVVASLWMLTLAKKGAEGGSQEGVEIMGANGERGNLRVSFHLGRSPIRILLEM